MNSKVTLSEAIDTDYKLYSMYVLENRAIPSYIDGLKPVHRKILYAMLNEHGGKKTKVADLGGISKYNYHHGESSAMGAAVTLTAAWNNNVPLFTGHGNFGSRLIQDAAAPRYIFASLNNDFKKYFTDFEVCDKNVDPENPEPQSYLPLIPWVLVNGIEGIAVGFSCRFLPHVPSDLVKACKLSAKGKLKSDAVIPVTFPGFKGEIVYETPTKVVTRGIVTRTKRNTWEITETPWGYDREQVFNLLTKLMDDGKISDFDDNCDANGFSFTVKVDSACDAKATKDPISYFKLEKAFTENYTTLDENGKLRLFDTKADIVNAFVEYRIGKVKQKIAYDLQRCEEKCRWAKIKKQFIEGVVANRIDLRKFTRATLLDYCKAAYKTTDDESVRLGNISVVDMTTDKIEELEKQIEALTAETKRLNGLTAPEEYLRQLDGLK